MGSWAYYRCFYGPRQSNVAAASPGHDSGTCAFPGFVIVAGAVYGHGPGTGVLHGLSTVTGVVPGHSTVGGTLQGHGTSNGTEPGQSNFAPEVPRPIGVAGAFSAHVTCAAAFPWHINFNNRMPGLGTGAAGSLDTVSITLRSLGNLPLALRSLCSDR